MDLNNNVDVDWFVFHVVQLPPIILTQQNLFCISKSKVKHQTPPLPPKKGNKKRIENRISSNLVMVVGVCLFVPQPST